MRAMDTSHKLLTELAKTLHQLRLLAQDLGITWEDVLSTEAQLFNTTEKGILSLTASNTA